MKRENLYIRSFRGEDGFNEFVGDLGGDPEAITKAAGLTAALEKGLINFEDFAGVCRLFEEASRQTNEPHFGLKWALHQPEDFRFSGPIVFLLSLTTNARQWLDMAIKYQKIHTNGFSYNYEENEPAKTLTGVINSHPFVPPCRQLLEANMTAIAVLVRQFMPDFKFNLVTFQHGPPENITLLEDHFKCPVIYNADRNTLITDLHYLKRRRTAIGTKILTPIVKTYMDWCLYRHPQTKQSISMMVSETIPAILGVKGSHIEYASQALNIHPKKLQRLLKQEGTSYSNILDDVRKNIAERLLTESNISIERLSKMLDYSSVRPFTVASKRWFGMSATDYRHKVRTQATR